MSDDSTTSLRAKMEAFDRVDGMRFYQDEGEGDDFASQEERDRQHARSFFHRTQAGAKETTGNRFLESSERGRAATPKRVSSAPTPGQTSVAQVIKATQPDKVLKDSRLRKLLEHGSKEGDEDETVIPDTERPTLKGLKRSDSTPMPALKRLLRTGNEASPSAGPAVRKRKRNPADGLPLEEQIFGGLAFFYIPNNDIAKPRRLRINKAKEYGATWTRSISTATHVVVEKNLEYKDVEKELSGARKDAPPKVVTEDYPIDCIQFRSVLDHRQKRYQLRGQPTLEMEGIDNGVDASMDKASLKSLQLKPRLKSGRKGEHVPSIDTPSQSQGPSQKMPGRVKPQTITIDLTEITDSSRNLEEDEVSDKEHNEAIVQPRSESRFRESGGENCGPDAVGDELSEYISMLQEFRGLPLDAEEDDDDSVGDEQDRLVCSDSEEEHLHTKQSSRGWPKAMTFEDRFACNQATSLNAFEKNPNARTIEVLQRMADYYDRVNDHWRTTAYRKAIATLKRQPSRISTEGEAFKLPNIGRRLAQKIEEIATTDKLQRLAYAQKEPMDESLQLFLNIYGVGSKQAQQWIAQGFRTLDDLKSKAKLTINQRVGIEHFDDLNTKIPRREVEALAENVRLVASRIDPTVELIVGGSYRRGAERSSDIDFIVTKPDTDSSGDLLGFLDDLVRQLEKNKFLVARLASSRRGDDGSTWHGCCVLPKIVEFNDDEYRPIWRRIDFLLVPESEKGAALIYFTGNDIFNRSIRLLASKKGMRLNQRGLYRDVLRGPGRTKVAVGSLVEGRSEEMIFAHLGVKWREPHERWC